MSRAHRTATPDHGADATRLALRLGLRHPVRVTGKDPQPRTFADLERQAHVPFEQLVTERPEPPAAGPLSAEEFDRQQLLGVTGAGRLHPG